MRRIITATVMALAGFAAPVFAAEWVNIHTTADSTESTYVGKGSLIKERGYIAATFRLRMNKHEQTIIAGVKQAACGKPNGKLFMTNPATGATTTRPYMTGEKTAVESIGTFLCKAGTDEQS